MRFSLTGGELIGKKAHNQGGCLFSYHSKRKKIKGTENTHKKLCKHIENEITETKKLFSWTKSAVMKLKEVVNKVDIETGFPCIPTILREWWKRRGVLVWHYGLEGRGLFGRGHLLAHKCLTKEIQYKGQDISHFGNYCKLASVQTYFTGIILNNLKSMSISFTVMQSAIYHHYASFHNTASLMKQ